MCEWREEGPLFTEAEFLFLITHNFKSVIATGLNSTLAVNLGSLRLQVMNGWKLSNFGVWHEVGPFSQIRSQIGEHISSPVYYNTRYGKELALPFSTKNFADGPLGTLDTLRKVRTLYHSSFKFFAYQHDIVLTILTTCTSLSSSSFQKRCIWYSSSFHTPKHKENLNHRSLSMLKHNLSY